MNQDYRSSLLNLINEQERHYRLPEPEVFAEFEDFKTQVNQVLAYCGYGVHFRHCINNPDDPKDDGGELILYNAQHQFVSLLATWAYTHPFHTFPVSLSFGNEKYDCHKTEDIHIAFNALLQSDVFKNILNLHSIR